MHSRIRLLPYNQSSKSAKALAEELGAKRLKLEGSRFSSRPGDLIINWGNSNFPDFLYSTNLNCVPLVRVTNKLQFFQRMEGAEWLPSFWTDEEDIPDEAFPVVARTVLNGHSGVGIVVCHDRSELVDAPLYVKYIKKQHEYRIHVGRGPDGIIYHIAAQQKKRNLEHDNPNWQIRNHANGFIYAREGVNPPAGVYDAADDCLLRTSLDFGAVDVIWNENQQRAYVLEVNTAPGLEGQTVKDYADFFRGFL